MEDWLKRHPWIRKSNEEGVHYNHMAEELDEKGSPFDYHKVQISNFYLISRFFYWTDFSNINLRKKLMSMVATCLKSEAGGDHKKLDSLLERQDWLDNLRKVII